MEGSGLKMHLTEEHLARMVSGKHPRSARSITPSKWTKPHLSTGETLPNKYVFPSLVPSPPLPRSLVSCPDLPERVGARDYT